MFLTIRSVDFIIDKVFVINNTLKIRYIGSMSLYDIFFQCVSCYHNCRLSCLAMTDELAYHRVVAVGYRCWSINATIDSHAAHLRFVVQCESCWCRHEIVFRVFSIYSAFDSVSVGNNRILGITHHLAACDTDLLFHDVNSGSLFCDWMFHLYSGVHLKEIEILVLINDKLNSTCVVVIHLLADVDSGITYRLTSFF